jgi:hypothetical protein
MTVTLTGYSISHLDDEADVTWSDGVKTRVPIADLRDARGVVAQAALEIRAVAAENAARAIEGKPPVRRETKK